jgi:ADP-ribosylglycohydrolase
MMRRTVTALLILLISCTCVSAQDSTLEDRIYGLLAGSALGDGAGGPVEFVYPQERTFWSTTDKALTEEGIEELAALFRLRAFPPEAEPYAQFEPYAPPASVTDDTRWKMILFNCLEEYGQLDPISFAKTFGNSGKIYRKNTIPSAGSGRRSMAMS